MKLTVLTENTASRRGMLAEHGLSVLVETGGRKILFDTGQTDVFQRNASVLGISLEGLDAVVLSHGHYDHGGGLQTLFQKDSLPAVYLGRGALEEKLCEEKDGSLKDIGIPWRSQRPAGLCLLENAGRTEIFPDIFLVSGMTKRTEYEGVPSCFLCRRAGKLIKDEMQDEQMLVVRENGKLHVVAGCCHMGIVSCLQHVRSLFLKEPFGMIFAGMHLRGASAERIKATIEAIREMEPDCLVPVHCTGILAIAQMKFAFGKKCRLAEAGKVLEIF